MDENDIIPIKKKTDSVENMSVEELEKYKKKLQEDIVKVDKEINNRKNTKIEAENLFKK